MDYNEINELLEKYSNFIFSKNSTDESTNKNSEKENYKSDFNCGFFYTNENGYGCNDMPGGFQRINPMLFIVIGDILGDLMSGRLPFNVQNAVGNWIQLVGQSIETYSSQQQYFQGGPGRYYSSENFNITNPFCSSTSSNNQSTSNNETNSYDEKLIEGLYYTIREMKNELDDVKSRINTIERKEK